MTPSLPNCLVIDDDELNAQYLSGLLIKNCPDWRVMDYEVNSLVALKAIEHHPPDVLFLDISMPGMNGFELLENLSQRPKAVVFTTAHEEYALTAIRHQAADYLLKPIDLDELLATLARVRILLMAKDRVGANTPPPTRIAVAMQSGLVFIKPSDIVYLESDGAYTVVHLKTGGKHVASKNLGEFERQLERGHFFRIHKQFIINLDSVAKFIRTDGFYVELETGRRLEVSRRKKDNFMLAMDRFSRQQA